MRRYGSLFLVMGCLFGFSLPCPAQEQKPVSVTLNLDMRSRLATGGVSRSALYSGDVQLKARLAPGLHFLYDGRQCNAPVLTGAGARFNRFLTDEAALEKVWGTQRMQLGIVRLPFGIYNPEETYASGLIDYPLVRVDYALNAVNWSVPGVRWNGGSPALRIEAAGFGGQAAGVWGNLNNVAGAAVRLQTYTNGLVLGYSRWDGTQSASLEPDEGGPRSTHINGLDLRFTRPHLLLRGEYMFGVLGGEQMHGWYLDTYYHLPKYEKWTLVARLEEFQGESDISPARQVTLGVRYTMDQDWIFALNWRRNSHVPYHPTWTPDTGSGGDIFFQAYRKFHF
jgi:hypothetical protein